MRHARRFAGFEVTLEGRSCVVAFSGAAAPPFRARRTERDVPTHVACRRTSPADVHMAARWALTTQADLMQVPWPVELEQSPLCRVESVDGHVIFKGLRVRMGIHTGEPTVSLNPLTRRAVYTGPVVNKAWRVCFTADGGMLLGQCGSLKWEWGRARTGCVRHEERMRAVTRWVGLGCE